ncbi:MAG: hypothetical protein A3J24_08705 [Deltaproteobacteria bacterium RIFCSPLOWO2_02_FULL_53_8]|nr:MAG: hypothetical protein A3J24_08705 [Deltaproteobacteria bacterium RIFCSPLOWO2_02_FULL_53_8]
METAKQEATRLIASLPDDCSLEEIQYHLFVMQKIEAGLRDMDSNRLYSQEEVERKMTKWLGK